MQAIQEAAEDSKNLDTFDAAIPVTSSSLAELSAASASLEMAAEAAARAFLSPSTKRIMPIS